MKNSRVKIIILYALFTFLLVSLIVFSVIRVNALADGGLGITCYDIGCDSPVGCGEGGYGAYCTIICESGATINCHPIEEY